MVWVIMLLVIDLRHDVHYLKENYLRIKLELPKRPAPPTILNDNDKQEQV